MYIYLHTLSATKLHERHFKSEDKFLEITEDPTFAGPPHPASLLKVREQHRLLQIRDPLHAGGTAASSRHVLDRATRYVCGIGLLQLC